MSDTLEQPTIDVQLRLRAQTERWKAALTDLGKTNNALYFVERKSGTLQLPPLTHPQVKGFADGAATLDLQPFFPTEDHEKLDRSLRRIRDVARSNEQERGLRTLYVALGTATWRLPTPTKGDERAIRAPLAFLPVEIEATTRGPIVRRGGDLTINSILLAAIDQHYGLKLELPQGDEGPQLPDRLDAIVDLVGQMFRSVPGFATNDEVWLSTFSFAKQSMVEDLAANGQLLERSALVRAFVDDETALVALQKGTLRFEREQLDTLDPLAEALVIEADEYQRAAIQSLIESSSSGVIDGPPGTGKSQTIANLIAALIARNQRVLFVAEKQAALDAVMKRLQDARLDHLVLNMHGADVKRRAIYDRLKASHERSRAVVSERAPNASATEVVRSRTQLTAFYEAVNRPRDGADLSIRDLVGRVAAASRAGVRSDPLWLGAVPSAVLLEQAAARVALLALRPGIFRRDLTEPWARAAFDGMTLYEAQKAVEDARTALRELVAYVEQLAGLLDARVRGPADVDVIRADASVIAALSSAFKPEVAKLDAARELATYRRQGNGFARWWASLFNSDYKASVGRVSLVAAEAVPTSELFRRLEALVGVDAGLRTQPLLAAVAPTYPRDLDERRTAAETSVARATAVTGESGLPTAFADLERVLAGVAQARTNAAQAYDVRLAERWLAENGFRPLIDALLTTDVVYEHWETYLRASWAASHVERAFLDDPVLRNFHRPDHEGRIKSFAIADASAMGEAAAQLRVAAASRYERARVAFPKQRALLDREIVKRTTRVTVRSFVEQAWEVASALCPCWMASPLSVSNLIAPRAVFDVVIFDEASQVTPENAITAIMRGQRTIVAGDEQQLPPTRFFAAGAPEGDGFGLEGMESLLTQMLAFVGDGRQELSVHYRSRDESLIRFSNDEFYRRLVTFPSAGGKSAGGIRHVHVTEPPAPGESVSSSSEVERVAQLIAVHAREHPDESLGIISMGLDHAERLDARIQRLRAADPVADAFFARHESRGDDVFVKNIERVQGDERDAIILSLGYAKQPGKPLANMLGPINMPNGQRRINVLITRAKIRMTVVSTFTENDMPDGSFKNHGAPVFKRFVAYARRGGARPPEARAPDDRDLALLEQDIIDELRRHGLAAVAHVGTSEARVEIGVRDPRDPTRFALAIEGDGASYARSRTARDRDYLRQRQLEARGWRFHRIWTPDWKTNRDREIARAVAAYESALSAITDSEPTRDERMAIVAPAPAQAESSPAFTLPAPPTTELGLASALKLAATPTPPSSITFPMVRYPANHERSKANPHVPYLANIDSHEFSNLEALCDWIMSDRVERDNEMLMRELMSALGYGRKGERIEKRLTTVIKRYRKREARTASEAQMELGQ